MDILLQVTKKKMLSLLEISFKNKEIEKKNMEYLTGIEGN